MKKIFLTLLVASTFLFSSNLDKLTYKEVFELSQDKLIDKPILVMIAGEDCKFCKKELKDMNNNDKFKDFINKNYIFVYINQDKDFTPIDLQSQMVPSFYVINPVNLNKMIKEPARGAIPLDNLQNWLKEIANKYENFKKGLI